MTPDGPTRRTSSAGPGQGAGFGSQIWAGRHCRAGALTGAPIEYEKAEA